MSVLTTAVELLSLLADSQDPVTREAAAAMARGRGPAVLVRQGQGGRDTHFPGDAAPLAGECAVGAGLCEEFAAAASPNPGKGA
ncbi:hypothetical protein [Kitasatospora sp. NPDC088783]|uniref:hypothetical protein n=1 Tax=Kitasatospora sp. NPDC088783 TaxID=3364077 RepID=UPI00382F5140